jgi:hypothetical protein
MSSLSGSTLEPLLHLVYPLFFLLGGFSIFSAVRNWVEESQEDKLAPVRLSSSQSVVRSMSPAHWRCRYQAGLPVDHANVELVANHSRFGDEDERILNLGRARWRSNARSVVS